MGVTMFFLLCDVGLLVLVAWAMATDWQRIEITNHCVLLVLGLGVLKLLFAAIIKGSLAVLGVQLIIAFGIFALGFALFWFGAMGGGDVKLLAALGLWLSLGQLPLFLIIMSVVGGLLGGFALLVKRHPQLIPAHYAPPSWLGCLKAGQPVVAYGLAIGCGVWAVFLPTIITAF
jgi:prepilin peptidase CpaA